MKSFTVTQAHRYAVVKSRQYPEVKSEILDFIQLMYDEIESGESPENEATLLIASVEDLINENTNE